MEDFKCCYKCKKRGVKEINGKLVSCHSSCKKYKEYAKKLREQNEQIREKKRLDSDSYAKSWARRKKY